MPKIKNVSGGDLDVPFLGMVQDGEIVDAPDFQADGESPLVWPTTDPDRPPRWELVTDKPAAKASAKTADDTSGKAAV